MNFAKPGFDTPIDNDVVANLLENLRRPREKTSRLDHDRSGDVHVSWLAGPKPFKTVFTLTSPTTNAASIYYNWRFAAGRIVA